MLSARLQKALREVSLCLITSGQPELGMVPTVLCCVIASLSKPVDNESLQSFREKTEDKYSLLSPSFSLLCPHQPSVQRRQNDPCVYRKLGEVFKFIGQGWDGAPIC